MGKKIEKTMGVLPITNRICYGKVDKKIDEEMKR